jgi:hypothetical protein
MTKKRYNELWDDPEKFLTNDEIEEGWHFCGEWDGMLVGPKMPETEFCNKCCGSNKFNER